MIARTSVRGRGLARRAKQSKQSATLNLVSLMDIFTILLLFLLVNSAAVEVLPNPKSMTLPESISEDRAAEVPVLMVTREQIVLQYGSNVREVMPLETAQAVQTTTLAPLKSAILESILLSPAEGEGRQRMTRGQVNIMADKDTPYSLLKKVMATCTEARFARISLAVIQKTPSTTDSAS